VGSCLMPSRVLTPSSPLTVREREREKEREKEGGREREYMSQVMPITMSTLLCNVGGREREIVRERERGRGRQREKGRERKRERG
jgi:hypothetical protein